MPITYIEKFEGPRSTSGPSPTRERVYVFSGSSVEADIRADAETNLPASIDGLTLREIEFEAINDTYWLARANWRRHTISDEPPPEAPTAGDSSFEFDVTTETVHISQAKATVGGFGPPSWTLTIPSFAGAIGVTTDDIEGCDVQVPRYTFSETHYLNFADTSAVNAFKSTVYGLTGKTNNGSFKGFPAGEVLFLGARGARRASDGLWEVTFRFSASPNVTGLTIGTITGIVKGGWEYLWVLYDVVQDAGAKRLVKRPAFAYSERVYDEGSFSALGIGT